MKSMETDLPPIAKRLVEAGASGDARKLDSCFTADAVVWHNFTNKEVTPQQARAKFFKVAERFADLRYEQIRITVTADGYVQQHVLEAVLKDGARITVPACIIVRTRDGLICRIDEYFDSEAWHGLWDGVVERP